MRDDSTLARSAVDVTDLPSPRTGGFRTRYHASCGLQKGPSGRDRYGPPMRFDTPITVTGPMRSPAQMLDAQSYDGHSSVHDDATAESMGLTGAPIEGPTHFSQFDPLAVALWGTDWFERGCISSHFQTMVVAGEEVQASLTTTGPNAARIEAHKADGQPVLTGTASLGPDNGETELGRTPRPAR